MKQSIDASGLLKAWNALPPGPKAELRRTAEPDDLLSIPAFYRLVQPAGWHEDLNQFERQSLLRLVFVLSTDAITNTETDISLGKALASNRERRISEMRLYQIIRSDWPNDMVQLRRVIKQVGPTLRWSRLVTQLTYWNTESKRRLLEDFVLGLHKEKKD